MYAAVPPADVYRFSPPAIPYGGTAEKFRREH